MSEQVKRMANAGCTILVGAVFLFPVLLARADDGIANKLHGCSSIEDATARLACYDGLGDRQEPLPVAPGVPVDSPAEPPPVEPAAVDQTADKSLDDPGSKSASNDSDEKFETVKIRAVVTRCRQDDYKKYYFYFEDGQVWKQTDRKRVKFKDCNFDVTITKDFFGYKMQQDGEDRRIRIRRVK